MKSYQDLDIYKISLELFFETHRFSLKLPSYEKYELGSQLRRSSDSINTNIVEGYGRKTYKQDFVKFLVYAHASNLECHNHLEKLKVLYPEYDAEVQLIQEEYRKLGVKIHNFIEYVKTNWKT